MSDTFAARQAHVVGSAIAPMPAEAGIAFDEHRIAYVVERIAGKDVLDLGCVDHNADNAMSRHWLHKAIKARAGSLVGLDLSADGVARLNSSGYQVEHGDAQNFALGRQFDAIVAGDLIEHLEDFSGFFNSCKAHLRPGGKLLIATPNPWYWRNIVKAVLSPEVSNNPEHTCWFCPRTLRQLAARHGFVLSDIAFGSRYARDRLMPLPRGIKHTSWNGTLTLA